MLFLFGVALTYGFITMLILRTDSAACEKGDSLTTGGAGFYR